MQRLIAGGMFEPSVHTNGQEPLSQFIEYYKQEQEQQQQQTSAKLPSRRKTPDTILSRRKRKSI